MTAEGRSPFFYALRSRYKNAAVYCVNAVNIAKARIKNWGELEGRNKCPDSSACVPERWIGYRLLDIVLHKIRFRHLPPECRIEEMENAPPFPSENGKPTAWQTLYDNSMKLIIHDDMLNWQKYHYMIILNVGLMTAYGVLYTNRIFPGYLILPLLGLVFAFLFDRTLQEGMRCLRSHRQKIRILDGKLFEKPNQEFLFKRNPYNQRDALELGPLLLFVMWFLIFVFSVCFAPGANP